MPAPCTVRLADPVVGTQLPPRAVLTRLMSTDHATLALPARRPLVNAVYRLAWTPAPAWQLIAVSDRQLDCSHPVLPARARPDPAASPSWPPTNVTLHAPVVPSLDLSSPLRLPTPLDTETDKLPSAKPVDTITRALCR